MVGVLVKVSTAVTKPYDQKEVEKERVCMTFTYFQIVVPHLRKPGQELKQSCNLEAGADAEVMEECCLLACSSWLAQPAFL